MSKAAHAQGELWFRCCSRKTRHLSTLDREFRLVKPVESALYLHPKVVRGGWDRQELQTETTGLISAVLAGRDLKTRARVTESGLLENIQGGGCKLDSR